MSCAMGSWPFDYDMCYERLSIMNNDLDALGGSGVSTMGAGRAGLGFGSH